MIQRCLTALLMCALLAGLAPSAAADATPAQSTIVLTLGADLSAEQRAYITQYFGVTESQVKTITITNADERAQLGGLISDEQIGTVTLSCALVRLTDSGGIQVKTANMNYVNCNMIATTLSTSGVFNCEVLTAAPYEVSGTGALTGVMMAYEAGSGQTLDPAKKELANQELVLTGEIADTVGQDQATLVVNDIKIHIVRDNITDQQAVNQVVDEVIATTDQAAAEAATAQGKAPPVKLGEVEHQKLYDFSYKFSQMGYEYKDMQRTLERVTHNVTESTGIKDPIEDTFTTLDDDTGLDVNSILLSTEDNVLGADAVITATNRVALGDHPAEPIDVFTGDVTLEKSGSVKVTGFIGGTNDIAYQDVSGLYALMDLNGNLLTEPVYGRSFDGKYGNIQTWMADGSGTGLLADNGDILIPFQYNELQVISEKWAVGITLTEGTEEDYDYYNWDGDHFQIASADVYYLDGENSALVSTLTRDAYGDTRASGDYLNIQDRSGVITTYDPSFTPLRTAEYMSDFGDYEESDVLSELLSDSTGYGVYSFRGNYAEFYDWNTSKYGVMDRYGNIIVPAEFDRIDYDMDDFAYENGGYFSGEKDGQFVYITAGGTVTAAFAHSSSDVYCYGMSAQYKGEDGSYTILSGDGVEKSLGTTYGYLSSISGSKGMFWVGRSDSSYDLLDWHGNVLLSGSDGYSLSANGNYLIAQDGYTSSTLYLVNGASPVALAGSVGGAVEVEAASLEAASLDAYTGDPQLELIGDTVGREFVSGTDLLLGTNDGHNYALIDVSGQQLTEPVYLHYFSCDEGWLIANREVGGQEKCGVVSQRGLEIIPCEYDKITVLDENWIVAYRFQNTATEDDYDFSGYDSSIRDLVYYYIDEAVIYHIDGAELTSVKLTRDQFDDAAAEGDYLNIRDRTTGTVTTYDGTFTAVGTVRNLSDFSAYSSMYVLRESLKDSTGYTIFDDEFPDGYTRIYDGDTMLNGVMDVNGNVVVPLEYDDVLIRFISNEHHVWANGYFAVEKGGMTGYVNGQGQVTCELRYPSDDFSNYGMAGIYKEADGTYTLVAADGTETKGFETLYAQGNGKLFKTHDGDGVSLLDWHGNVLLEGTYDVGVSDDCRFVVAQMRDGANKLYAVDGASVEEAVAVGAIELPEGEEPEASAPESESQAEPEAAPETTPEQAAAPTPEPTPEQETSPAPETSVGDETEAPAGEGQGQSAAAGLLTSAAALVEADFDANTDSVLVLLQQAKTILDTENPDAAAVVNSAITLLGSGVADADSISTLISTAQGML